VDRTRVLIVEDDDLDARLFERLFSRVDSFDLTRAKLLKECLDLLAQNEADLVLLDLGLPDATGGLDALHRAKEVAGDVPIVVLTGLSDEQVAMNALREGAQDYVVKETLVTCPL